MKFIFPKKLKQSFYLIVIMLGLPLTGLLILGIDGDHHFSTLPYYSAEGSMEAWSTEARQVSPFAFTNQEGVAFHSDSLDGKVWLAAFYSTQADHVAQMTKQLLWPNFRYRDEDDIATVCFTLDAAHDQPEVLHEYIQRTTRYNGSNDKWQFLTGDQEAIDQLISESFMIERDSEDPNNIATLWLVDGEGYLRGVYHAASEDAIKDAVEDIALLQKEMDEAAYARKKAVERAQKATPLPILGPEGHTVPPFAFLGMDSLEFSHRNVGNRLRIVDFFFTQCPSICPLMSSQMARLQHTLRARGIQDDVLLLSHSVDPEYDRPHRLREYGERIGLNPEQWQMVTGDKQSIYAMAREGYFLTALESDTAAGGFFHSDLFALIDRAGRIRGYYDGTSTKEVDQLLDDTEQLWILNQ
ncbi:MAG: SCO family protein [Bacteroidetes bacterium]|nr:SCO family protein [Bacteroidota bacterium]